MSNFKLGAIIGITLWLLSIPFQFLYQNGIKAQQEQPHSPVQLTEHDGPGTGHAFGFNIEYTVVRHETYGGVPMAVVHSGAPNEESVEIWSPIPQLVELKDGSSFILHEKETWDEAFELVKIGV